MIGGKNQTKNFILMEINYYIHVTNYNNNTLSLPALRGRFRIQEEVERKIAEKRNKIPEHFNKWTDVNSFLP